MNIYRRRKNLKQQQKREIKRKLEKEKQRNSSTPYGVLYCHEEKKPVGFVKIHIRADKYGKTYIKEKAKASFWKNEAKWLVGYEPSPAVLTLMKDGEKAICPKCGKEGSFIVMYNVKYEADLAHRFKLTPEKVRQMEQEDELREYDAKYSQAFKTFVEESNIINLPENMIRDAANYMFVEFFNKYPASSYIKERYIKRLVLVIDRYKKYKERTESK